MGAVSTTFTPASRARRSVATHRSFGTERSARSPAPIAVAAKPVRPSVRVGRKRGAMRRSYSGLTGRAGPWDPRWPDAHREPRGDAHRHEGVHRRDEPPVARGERAHAHG